MDSNQSSSLPTTLEQTETPSPISSHSSIKTPQISSSSSSSSSFGENGFQGKPTSVSSIEEQPISDSKTPFVADPDEISGPTDPQIGAFDGKQEEQEKPSLGGDSSVSLENEIVNPNSAEDSQSGESGVEDSGGNASAGGKEEVLAGNSAEDAKLSLAAEVKSLGFGELSDVVEGKVEDVGRGDSERSETGDISAVRISALEILQRLGLEEAKAALGVEEEGKEEKVGSYDDSDVRDVLDEGSDCLNKTRDSDAQEVLGGGSEDLKKIGESDVREVVDDGSEDLRKIGKPGAQEKLDGASDDLKQISESSVREVLNEEPDHSIKVSESDVQEVVDSGGAGDLNQVVDSHAREVLNDGSENSNKIDESDVREESDSVSDQANPVIVKTGDSEKRDFVPNTEIQTSEQESHENPEPKELEANSDSSKSTLPAYGENLTSDETQAVMADKIDSGHDDAENGRYESQTVSSTYEPVLNNVTEELESQPVVSEDYKHVEMNDEILENSSVTATSEVHNDPSESGPNVSNERNASNNLSDPDVSPSNDNSQVTKDKSMPAYAENGGLASKEGLSGGVSGAVEQIMRAIEQGSSSSQSAVEKNQEYPQKSDGSIMIESDDEVDTDDEEEGKELFDSAALAALLKAATSAGSDGTITINAPDAARLFSTERPAGLGPTMPPLKPASQRINRPNIFSPSELAVTGESDDNLSEEEKKLQEKIQGIRVKFLRLVQRLGHSPEDTVAAQVLYRLGLAEGIRRGRQTNRAFSLESAKKTATEMEAAGASDLDFSCNILILGKTGVGKSATINSIFGEEKTKINAFEPSTSYVKEIVGTVDGVRIRVIDTPGLQASIMDQSSNRRILRSIKKFTKKCPPDIVLYIDRLDTQTRDFNDLPLLRSISTMLGPSIWLNAIVALTHAASAPPDGPSGSPLSYEVFVAQRSHIVQHSIRQAAGDMRLMNPVALVENHPSCRRNREGQRVLPNGQNWRPQLLLLCYSSKILSEANSLLKLQDPSPGKLFGFRVRSPPLPYLLSSLLQTRAHPKLSTDAGGENVDSDVDLDDLSDSDNEEEDEYDQLPPFKPLKKSQIDKLSKEQRKAYFEEYDYRVKLLQKKQWKEELRRIKELKKRGKQGQNDFGYGDMGGEEYDQENGSPAAVPVPMPDMVLPPSFDSDNPAYRYRFLEPTSQLLSRPVLDTHGWDHDCGYDGVSLEESLAIVNQFPASVAVQITKDKREFNIHLDSSICAKHGEHGSTLAGFDIQSVGKQLAYILRGETKFHSFKRNKTTGGVSVTFLGENVATGLKVEDQISIGKRVSLVASTGAVRSQGDMAYGANLEARLKDKEYPVGQDQSTLGLSLMKWRGDLALGANLQTQFSVGRNSKMAVRCGLNNKLSGQITVRTSSSEQLQIALVGFVPIAVAIYKTIWPGETYFSH